MKVILDVDSLAPPLTGIGRYTLALARGLQRSERVENVKFFSLGRWVDDVEGLLHQGTSISTIRRHVPFRRFARWGYRCLSEWRFRQQIAQVKDYVYHAPNYRLLSFPGKSVVTIHDLSFIRHPEFHPKERALFWQREVGGVVARAGHVITDSEFQRAEIIQLLGVDADKVSAVHLGVDPSFHWYAEDACNLVMEKYGLRYKSYCLVVATVEPRKNFVRLLEAFERLPVSMRKAFPLAIVGAEGWLSDDIHAAIVHLVEKGQAVRLGYVEEFDLPKLYAAATMFIYPSLYEGFGLPVLEAMACGTAVLSSNTSSIPEVAGDACYLVDPYSVDEIADGWRILLDNAARRTTFEVAGLQRAGLFSWDRCIDQTINVYSRLP